MGIRTQVDIDPAALGITWAPNTQYRIAIESGFMVEDGGEAQPNPAVPSLLSFTTNATGPVLSSSSPASGATNVIGVSKVTLTYDRKVIKNSGFIKFYKVGSPDTLIQTLNVAETDVYLESDTHQLSFNLVDAIQDPTSTYYFTVDANAVKDFDNFLSPAITNANTIRFTTGAAPAIVSTTPTDNATGVNSVSIGITFDRSVKKGTGTINLYKASDDSLAHSINVNDSKVTFSGATVSINTTFLLEGSTAYYVQISQYAIRDVGGIYFAGIANKTSFNFTTSAGGDVGGILTDNLYVNNYLFIVYPTGTQVRATTQNQVDNTAGVKLYGKLQGASTYSLIRTFYFGRTAPAGESNAGAAECNVFNNAIRIFCSSYLENVADYYVTIDDNSFYNNVTGLVMPGVSTQTTALSFDTKNVFVEVVAKQYTGNQSNGLWLNPVAGDESYIIKALDPSLNYTLTFTSPIGTFGLDSATPVSTLTVTANRYDLRGYLVNGNIKFYPTKNTTTNSTITVVFKQGATTIATQTQALTYSGTSTTVETVTFNANGTFTPTYEQLTYRNTAAVLLVGGGGNAITYGGVTGGGGGVVEQSGLTISNTSYAYTVGVGGSTVATTTRSESGGTVTRYVGQAGGNTTIFGLTAGGGTGAVRESSSLFGDILFQGGNSGSPQSNAGTTGDSGQIMAGGAGETGAAATAANRKGALGVDSTMLGALGNYKLGAGGSRGGVTSSNTTREFPRDAGQGGWPVANPSGTNNTFGTRGIIVMKLTS
jgi:hypothetical protein